MSPANEAVVRSLWAAHPAEQCLVGLTGIAFREDVSPEMHLLSAIETIDLHHGLSSTEQPYTALEVIGVSLGTATRVALSDLGFEMFAENKAGFVATRAQPSSTTKIG